MSDFQMVGNNRYGVAFRINGNPRHYLAYMWCDCILGPHWHEMGESRTVAEAEQAVGFGRTVAS